MHSRNIQYERHVPKLGAKLCLDSASQQTAATQASHEKIGIMYSRAAAPTCFGSGDLRKPKSDVGFLALPQEIRSPCQQDIIQMHQLSALLCHNKSCASRTTASKSLGGT